MTGRLRVVVADDHYLVREGVRRALVSDDAIDVIAEFPLPAERRRR